MGIPIPAIFTRRDRVAEFGIHRSGSQNLFHPAAAQQIDEAYALRLGEETLQVQIREGEMKVQRGESQESDAGFYTNMQIFLGLLIGQLQPDEAISAGLVQVEGDPAALNRFLRYCSVQVPPG